MHSIESDSGFSHSFLNPGAGRAVAFVIAALFAVAAGSKLWNPIPTETLLRYLIGAPKSDAATIALTSLVVAWEFILVLLLISRPHSPMVLCLVAATLAVFTLVLLRLWSSTDAPACGCFGFLQKEYVGQSSVPPGIIRNLLLLSALGFVALTRPRQASDARRPPSL